MPWRSSRSDLDLTSNVAGPLERGGTRPETNILPGYSIFVITGRRFAFPKRLAILTRPVRLFVACPDSRMKFIADENVHFGFA